MEHLEANYDTLSSRSSVKGNHLMWWRPERPRSPLQLLRPKIVGPHLMLLPKFAVDRGGRFAVSRAPYMYHSSNDWQVLAYVVACLNSTIGHWQLTATSHKYSRGYARLEAKTSESSVFRSLERSARQILPWLSSTFRYLRR